MGLIWVLEESRNGGVINDVRGERLEHVLLICVKLRPVFAWGSRIPLYSGLPWVYVIISCLFLLIFDGHEGDASYEPQDIWFIHEYVIWQWS